MGTRELKSNLRFIQSIDAIQSPSNENAGRANLWMFSPGSWLRLKVRGAAIEPLRQSERSQKQLASKDCALVFETWTGGPGIGLRSFFFLPHNERIPPPQFQKE